MWISFHFILSFSTFQVFEKSNLQSLVYLLSLIVKFIDALLLFSCLHQKRRTYVYMDSPMNNGKLTCQLKKFLQNFPSLHWA